MHVCSQQKVILRFTLNIAFSSNVSCNFLVKIWIKLGLKGSPSPPADSFLIRRNIHITQQNRFYIRIHIYIPYSFQVPNLNHHLQCCFNIIFCSPWFLYFPAFKPRNRVVTKALYDMSPTLFGFKKSSSGSAWFYLSLTFIRFLYYK